MNMTIRVLGASLALLPLAAHAHHFMDNALPGTWWEGLLSGLGHPLIGIDHAAFMIAAGFLLARLASGLWGVAALIGGALLGALVHLAGLDLPFGELGVALSVLAAGAVVLLGRSLRTVWVAAGMALAGVLHGYAYAESIIGAEPTPLLAYLAGFSIIQLVVASGAFLLRRSLRDAWAARATAAVGFSAMAVGAAFLAVGFV